MILLVFSTISTENYVLQYTQIPLLGHIREAETEVGVEFVKAESSKIRESVHDLLIKG